MTASELLETLDAATFEAVVVPSAEEIHAAIERSERFLREAAAWPRPFARARTA